MYVNRRRAAKKRGQRFLIIYYQLARVWKSSDRMLPVVIIFFCCHFTLISFWRCMWMDSPDKVDDDDGTQPYMQCIAKLYQFLFRRLPPLFPSSFDVVTHDHNYFFCAIHMMNNNKPLYGYIYDCIFYGFENICFSRLLLLSSSFYIRLSYLIRHHSNRRHHHFPVVELTMKGSWLQWY